MQKQTLSQYAHCIFDTTNNLITNADDSFCKMFGYDQSAVLCGHVTLPRILYGDKKSNILGAYLSCLQNNRTHTFQHSCISKDYEVFTVLVELSPIDDIHVAIDFREIFGTRKSNRKNHIDTLTQLYNYDGASLEMQKLIYANSDKQHYLVLLHFWNYAAFVSEYGKTFSMSLLENIAHALNSSFHEYIDRSVLCRAGKRTFAILFEEEDPIVAEEKIRTAYQQLIGQYHGRNTNLIPDLTLVYYLMEPGNDDINLAFTKVGCTLFAAKDRGLSVLGYNEQFLSYSQQLRDVIPNTLNEMDEWEMDYNHRFISYAISLLSHAVDINSSIDLLIMRIGYLYKFDDVVVCEFLDDGVVQTTNKWDSIEGIITSELPKLQVNDWDNFFTTFNERGIAIQSDLSTIQSPQDRAFFKSHRMSSLMNLMLYANERRIGYISFTNENPRTLDAATQHTLIQLSKIFATFLTIRKGLAEAKEHTAALSYDDLTGLYEYNAFSKQLLKVLANHQPNKVYALTYTDLDNFSYLNSSFGYREGDKVLKLFANQLKLVSQSDTSYTIACHLMGDQFLVLSVRDSREEIINNVRSVNDYMTELLHEKYPLSDLRMSSGIYFIENFHPSSPYSIIDKANAARKSKKNDRHNNLGIYTHEMAIEQRRQLNIIGSIHEAIKAGEIVPFLQPKFSMNTMKIIGAEALVRWKKPDGSFIYPDQFIPVLEQAGYIVDVDFSIFEQVLKLLQKWKEDDRPLVPISINFSRLHMKNPTFVDRIIFLTERYGIDPKWVEIELTESVFIYNTKELNDRLQTLRNKGFIIDIDDFGTGYSSLSLLLDAPVDIVKVDKSFIAKCQTLEELKYISQVGNLITSTNKDIIFEGVEYAEQKEFLTDAGFDCAQGYLFSRPIPVAEFEEKYICKK